VSVNDEIPLSTNGHDDDGRTVSPWMEEAEARSAPQLAAVLEADVCVVGAGIAGLSVAYAVARDGRSVVVLDDGTIGGGQTKRTTAHLASALDDRFTEIERVHGAEGARVAAASHAAAIDRIEAVVAEEGIDCGFERVDGYLCLAGSQSSSWLDRELAAARRAGLADAERVPAAPGVPGLGGPCIRFPRQAQFHPLRYLDGLANAAERRGATLLRGHVERIEPQRGGGLRATVGKGAQVAARWVVVATNSPIHERVAVHTKQAPYRTYAMALSVPTGAVPTALYWDTLDPYHYVRVHPGGGADGGDLLIVGGEDHRIWPMTEPDATRRHAALETWARARFPSLGAVTHRWSGQVLETLDGLAFIGPTPSGPENLLMSSGDSGMGLTHGTIAGILLADRIAGRDNAWAPFYDPSRKPLAAALEYARENAETALGYAEWLRPGTGDPYELEPDSGGVFGWGLHKRAAYRDPDGRLHVRSATCPHLGGVVGWNDAEKTWDCPCHGSRFDRFGRVVQGPANADLDPAT
jgi:glycine/D-amino acid oxidase-like deaminating enzyme/nitrite reductase/ring-hydroxylating ferredoxin subunit